MLGHHHSHSHHSHHSNSKRLFLALLVTLIFMFTEVIGGLLSGSLALLADAGHMLTDSAALFIAIIAIRFAARLPTNQHSFGFFRFTTLAAFVNAAALLIIVVVILWEACQRFLQPQPIMGNTMLVIAIAGLLANLLSFGLLHQGNTEKNINIRAATLHILGDLLGSMGTIVAALIIMWTGWTPIDPILSVLVSCLIIRGAWRLLKESSHELLEGTPQNIDTVALQQALCHTFPSLQDAHHIHVWQIGEQRLMTLHVQVTLPSEHDDLLLQIQRYLQQQYHIGHATIQIEYQPCPHNHCDLNPIKAHSHQHAY